jgi:hypothetical protein
MTTVVSADDAAVVAANYPQRLISEFVLDFQEGSAAPVQSSAWKTLGDDLIVAAYSNGFTGAVRVLRRDGSIVNEPSLKISGVFPRVDVVNLDGVGSEEVIVSFSSPRGRDSNWVFRWTGTALDLIGPATITEDGDRQPALVNAGWVDLDGNGTLELYAPSGEIGDYDAPPPPPSFDVYRLVNGEYVEGGSIDFVRTFERSTSRPSTVTQSLSVAPGSYELRVVNNGVTSAQIDVNGVAVISPAMFKGNVRVISVPVTLHAENTLTVQLASAPGSSLTVVLQQHQ